MHASDSKPPKRDPLALRIHLLGHQVDWATCQRLQERLVYEADQPDGAAMTVLMCEHPPVITIGRRGSRTHVRLSPHQLRAHQIDLVWVNRGGGCIFHAPGQLAIYPVISLSRVGWSLADFLHRFRQAILQGLRQVGLLSWSPPGQFGCWGRSGLLAACGLAVHRDVTCHGWFLNVHPPMGITRQVQTVPSSSGLCEGPRAMSSLLSERGHPMRMPRVRSALIESLGVALARPRYHLYAGHLYLPSCREMTARAS